MKEYIVKCDNNKFTIEGEIVRCKGCRWFDVNRANFVEGYGYCEIYEVTNKDSHYCSYGEKQVTGKLNNPDDSLVTEDSEGCKEQESKLYIPLNQHTVERINRLHKNACGDYFDEEWLYNELEQIAEIIQLSPETSTNKVDTPTTSKTETVDTDTISRQAIEYHTQLEARGNGQYEEVEVAYKSDIESLPPVEPKPTCEDAISRTDTVNALCRECQLETKCDVADCHENWCTEVAVVMDMPPVTPTEQNEEDILKFYYVESLDEYWIGQRCGTRYYGKWTGNCFTFGYSRYLPWGEHVVAPDTLWKEHTYPSEPKEIPFNEWLQGFLEKKCQPERPKGHGRLIDADKLLQDLFTVDEEEWTTPEIRTILENAPTIIIPTERPKTTETMMVDGEPTEIDPLSYEVGYTHGQFSDRPKGEWILECDAEGYGDNLYSCSECGQEYGCQEYDLANFCPECGANMRGEK